MHPSTLIYTGFALAAAGTLATTSKKQRRRGAAAVGAGLVMAAAGLAWPAREEHADAERTKLDHFMPRWQFSEHHEIEIAAPPERVDEAIRLVRANEIALFRTLTWIRRGGRKTSEGILNPSDARPILDVAQRDGFVLLADVRNDEIVLGKVVIAPPGISGTVDASTFERDLPPGFAMATMNFLMRPDGHGGTHLTTETRVFANDAKTARRFAIYWRMIYPGSALLRHTWLSAIRDRAEVPPAG